MSLIQIISGILLIIASIFVIIVVVLQESKTNMSGAISGAENYASKGKSLTKDILLSKLTKIITFVFFGLVLAVNVISLLF